MKRILSASAGNIGSLLLALVLAVSVWANAATLEDPDEVRALSFTVPVTVEGLREGLVAQGYESAAVQLTVRAPRSVWTKIAPENVHVIADLKGKAKGRYTVGLTAALDLSPARVDKMEPSTLDILVDQVSMRIMAVHVELSGSTAPGFQPGTPVLIPETVALSGPAALVDTVVEVVAPLNVEGLRSPVDQNITLLPLDPEGNVVPGVSINPEAVSIALPVQQLGGYRDLVVKAVLAGSVRSGYRLTGLTVTPPVVTLYSDDPDVISGLPGYVETQPLDITGLQEDVVRSLSLLLPSGVQVVGDPKILVQVSISAIEDSVTITRPLRCQGLDAGLSATFSPSSVDVILSGPVPDLRDLRPTDVDVFLDLTGLGPGTYKVTPVVRIVNSDLRVVAVFPEQIEVVIVSGITPTP